MFRLPLGVIVCWLPASGDDEALWHLQHQDDSDEEDLDETELAFALAAHATDQLEPTAAEKEYLAKLEKEEAATDTGAADSDTPGKGRVTRQKSDGNSKEEDDKGDESDSGSESSMEVTSGFGRVLDEAYGAQRLWLSAEGRERWREALSPPRSIALVALAIAGLRAHCRRFRGLQVSVWPFRIEPGSSPLRPNLACLTRPTLRKTACPSSNIP